MFLMFLAQEHRTSSYLIIRYFRQVVNTRTAHCRKAEANQKLPAGFISPPGFYSMLYGCFSGKFDVEVNFADFNLRSAHLFLA